MRFLQSIVFKTRKFVDLKIELYKTNNNDGNFDGDWSQLYLDNTLKGNKVKENSCSTFKIIR